MPAHLIVTAVGRDRPGLVDLLSRELKARDLNIETSRMALLGGEFAMHLLVSGGDEEVAALAGDPAPLAASTGLEVTARLTDPPGSRPAPKALPYRIATAGMDHPGIVHDVASVLHRFQASIEEMDTRVTRAANSGTPVFHMDGRVAVPVEVRIRELREALQELGDRLNMDIEFVVDDD